MWNKQWFISGHGLGKKPAVINNESVMQLEPTVKHLEVSFSLFL